MASGGEPDLAAVVLGHLADIAAGRCTITDRQIAETARSDPQLAEVLTGLLFLHEDLALRVHQRDQAVAATEAVNRDLEAFSYSVAHDLRAPLRSIDGFSQALLEDYTGKLDSKGQRYLHHVREGAQRMSRLIDDLLRLSRVTRSELHRGSVDLSALARAIMDGMAREGPQRKVELLIADGLVVNGDARLLGVVLENLLGNSWKFTSKRPVTRIEFGLRQEDGAPVYFVRDNGAGFDMAYADKLFGVFQRLHSAAEFEGNGIGLATVQRIIQRHRGLIWAEGEVDGGATVHFTIGEEHG